MMGWIAGRQSGGRKGGESGWKPGWAAEWKPGWTPGRFPRRPVMLGLLLLAVGPVGAAAQSSARLSARELVDRGMELMGGEAALRAVNTVSLSMMTQWQETGFRGIPGSDRPSFERHHDRRDYRIPAWRNTRDFGARQIVNIIRDTVATTDFGNGPAPLNIAYVDEREELFVYTPDRLLLRLADAPDLSVGADTMLAGEPHHRVRATLSGRFPSEVFFHAVSGAPTMLRFVAGHPNDYGLVPWGEMEVEVWYNGWRGFGDLAIPTQWDVFRVGQPYKRMTVQQAVFNPEFAADSFVVSDVLRLEYMATQAMPMHETRPIDSVSVVDGLAVTSGGFGAPLGALNTGDGWLMLGAGQTGWNLERGVEAFEAEGVSGFTGVLVASAITGNGGVGEAARRGWPIFTTPSAEPYVREMLAAEGVDSDVRILDGPRRIGSGADALVIEPFSMPDAPRSIIAWHEASGWLYVPDARDGFGIRRGLEVARSRGWDVRWVGLARPIKMAVPGG